MFGIDKRSQPYFKTTKQERPANQTLAAPSESNFECPSIDQQKVRSKQASVFAKYLKVTLPLDSYIPSC